MATRPTRETTAPKVIRQLLRQVDVIHLHLDGFEGVPNWGRHPKIHATVHPHGSALGAAGKLEAFHFASDDDLVLMVDDDVRLPKNLAKTLQRAVQTRLSPTLFGFHGSTLKPPVESYLKDREVVQLDSELEEARRVDVVATCVAAFVKKDLTPLPDHWTLRNAVDLQLSLDAERQGVNRILLPRKRNWLSFQDSFQTDSIYRQLVEDDSRQTALARNLASLQIANKQKP